MSSRRARLRQVIDWSSALWAGLIAGTVFLALLLFVLPAVIGGNAWVMIRLLGSIMLGQDVLAPPATSDAGALIAALVTTYGLSVVFTVVLAIVIYRWGILVGILGGALFGLAIYCINIYTFTLLFPWFAVMRHWTFALAHVIFGVTAGGLYETLEVEEYVPEAAPASESAS